MVQFTAQILRFGKQGEKTGWTYFEIPADLAETLNPGIKKSYRVKGRLDHHAIRGVAILPMGGGRFILPLNADLRKAIGKRQGATLQVRLELDARPVELAADLLECLADEPIALERFSKLPLSHKNYYSKWVLSAKTAPTRARRIARVIQAMVRGQTFSQMMREARQDKDNNR
ncbi:MAG TPA: YdeI/OmpD-associated family protein [Chitinophagaceae bacterium]|nr:YdeI/OmpD-associated family protein [Chitinophagaceae bacterium]